MASPPTLGQWLEERGFSLGMSSGFFSFFAHAGMLDALECRGLRPRRVVGSSAGALVAGVWASGVSAADLARELMRLERRDFWDPRPGPGLLAGRLFRARLESILSARSFEACRVPLAVSVYDLVARATRVLDSGELAPAIHASCAVPLMFHPVWIDRRPHYDGGVADRPGLQGLPADAGRVLFHHIASRSPWSSEERMEIPGRDEMTTLVVERLPRVGPFRLHRGREAFELARAATLRALERPVRDGLVFA